MGRNKSRLRIAGWSCAAAALASLAVVACWQGLTVRRYPLRTAKLTKPARLAVIADLHSGWYGTGQKDLLAAIARETPDAVLLAGDIADDVRPQEGTLALLDAIGRAYPCFYVIGNHEARSGQAEELKKRFRSRGVTVLEGTAAALELRGGRLYISGVDDPAAFADPGSWRSQVEACRAGADGTAFSVLLSHRPERVRAYANSGFDLVAAGHAHGGQVRLPGLVNGLYAPHQGLLPHYAGGMYALGTTAMVVSRGLARNWLPRVFNRPELVIVRLEPA